MRRRRLQVAAARERGQRPLQELRQGQVPQGQVARLRCCCRRDPSCQLLCWVRQRAVQRAGQVPRARVAAPQTHPKQAAQRVVAPLLALVPGPPSSASQS